MSDKKYLFTFEGYENYLVKAEEGDVIDFEMPSFCSGDYQATIKRDEHGLYIDGRDNYMRGCRDFEIIKKEN